jgi:V/A-type H+-transporting ATPase subunit E
MSEDLQALIDRIRKEAIETADQQSQKLLADAQQKSRQILADAEQQAARTVAEAEQQSRALVERGMQSLAQAARDLLLGIGDQLIELVQQIVRQRVDEAMQGDVLPRMLEKLAEGYFAHQREGARLDVIVGEQDRERLGRFVLHELRAKLRHGVELHTDAAVGRGFRLTLEGSHAQHDFSAEAVAQALGQLLRPQLAEIVQQVALEVAGGKKK